MKSWIWALPRRLAHLGLGRVRPAVADVVLDRVVEQHGVLRDHAERRAERGLRHVLDVLSVDQHAARGDVVEAEQDARDGRLAGARRPDDGDHLPGRHLEAHMFQDRPLGIVGERHVLELDLALGDVKRLGARAIDHLRRLVQQREHRLDVDQPLLDLAIDHAHEIERQVKLHEDRVDHHEAADGEHAVAHVARREQHADDRAHGEDHRLAGVEHSRERYRCGWRR